MMARRPVIGRPGEREGGRGEKKAGNNSLGRWSMCGTVIKRKKGLGCGRLRGESSHEVRRAEVGILGIWDWRWGAVGG